MNNLRKWFDFVLSGEKEGKWVKILLYPLCLLSFFYGMAVRARACLYERGIFSSHSLSAKVISVGNITLGGTGKTPFASFLAEAIQVRGFRVAILSRGYMGTFPGPFGAVSDGEKILMEARQAGDESYLLAKKLRGIPVIVGKKRWLSGRFAIERFKSQVVILDDGFQHLPLKRDVNLLLLDAQGLFGNGWLFPRGSLREPLSHIKRADALILTKCDQADNINNLKKKLCELAGHLPVFAMQIVPVAIQPWGGNETLPLEIMGGRKVLAFSGIGRPDSFRKTLIALNSSLVGFETFPDHYWYKPEDFQRLVKEGEERGAEALVATEKDLTRLEGFMPDRLPLWAVAVKHEFMDNDREEFEEFLWAKADMGQ
jgi:tetraacyldisaccharide 4'-kinase